MDNNEIEKTMSQIKNLIDDLEEDDRSKIPNKVKSFFEKNSKNNEYKLRYDIPFEEQNLSEMTKSFLKYIFTYIKR